VAVGDVVRELIRFVVVVFFRHIVISFTR
jgi:hypothetical protein